MTDLQPEKIRVMALAEAMPALKPGHEISYIVSVGQPAHQGSILLGIIEWLAKEQAAHHCKVNVLIADTAQRFNARIGNDIPEGEAFRAAEENGVKWKMRHTPDFEAAGIVEIDHTKPGDLKNRVYLRWEDLRGHPDFQATHDGFKLLYAIDRKFAKDVDATRKEFLGRPSRPPMDAAQLEKAAGLVHDFLIEEAAVYTLFARLHPGIAVYPGKALKAFRRPREDRFYTPASLTWDDLPASIRASRQRAEKPNTVFRRAVTGMHLQKFIQLEKHSNRKKRKFFPAYSISAVQESMHGFYSNLNEHDRSIVEALTTVTDSRALLLAGREAIALGAAPISEDMVDILRLGDERNAHASRPPTPGLYPAAPNPK